MKKKQTIFITGASSGIGKAAALKLAEQGHKVFAGIRRKSDKAELEEANNNITGVYIDVTNNSSIEKAFWFVIKQTNKIDVLINNAGIATAGPVELIKYETLEEQFKVNTFGPVMVTQKFLPLLDGSKIINISSMASSGIFPYISAYCASKRALDILFNCFALENKDRIKVISVKPAAIKTSIWNKTITKTKQDYAEINEIEKYKYNKELLFLEKNAIKNNNKGIDVKRVVKTIQKIINSENPKSSYCIGFKSNLACFVSKLPDSIINGIIRFKLKIK